MKTICHKPYSELVNGSIQSVSNNGLENLDHAIIQDWQESTQLFDSHDSESNDQESIGLESYSMGINWTGIK